MYSGSRRRTRSSKVRCDSLNKFRPVLRGNWYCLIENRFLYIKCKERSVDCTSALMIVLSILRPCLHGVGYPGLAGLVCFVFTLWGTQNQRNLPTPYKQGLRACLREGGRPQVGEVTCGGLPHLTCKRDLIKMRDYMDRRPTQPKRVTSPIWGYPNSM